MSSTVVRRNGPYAPLGANYADDDAIATLDVAEDDRTELLYLRGLAYCARDPRTEGYISDIALTAGKVLRRSPVRKSTGRGREMADTIHASAARLAELGLWTREGDGYRVRSWSKWNKTWDEITRTRAKDLARKTTDGDRNEDGNASESDTIPSGTPQDSQHHGTSRHGSTRQSTAGHGSSTAPAETAGHAGGGSTGQDLLDEHLAALGPLPAQTRTALARHVEQLLTDGQPPDAIRTGLAEWRRRPAAKPGLLPHLVGDAAQHGPSPDPLSTPAAQAYRAAQNGTSQ